MSKKTFMAVTTISLLLFSLAVGIHFCSAQSGTQVSGIISQDTTWTKANSPYSLIGNVFVNSNVTLTIEAGAVVNLINCQIEVNGVLSANGTSSDPIHINGNYVPSSYGSSSSAVTFTPSSPSWSALTGYGSIIDNAIINSTSIELASSAKISNSAFIGSDVFVLGASPSISNNNLNVVDIYNGSPVISENSIQGGIDYVFGSQIYILDNVISKCQIGINFRSHSSGNVVIQGNEIVNDGVGIQTNSNNPDGQVPTVMWETPVELTIQNNTIANNSLGISLTPLVSPPVIIYNNILNNGQYNIQLSSPNDVNATYNWWGTTDTQAINKTIFDSKNYSNFGTVSFVPILLFPNPQTTIISVKPASPTISPTASVSSIIAPSPSTTQQPTLGPSATPNNTQENLTPILIIAALVVAVVVVALLVYFSRRKEEK